MTERLTRADSNDAPRLDSAALEALDRWLAQCGESGIMIRRTTLAGGFASATALSLTLSAQAARAQLQSVPIGAHVRVTTATPFSRVEGTLLANSRDSIAIATSPGVVHALGTPSITRFEVRARSRLAGAKRGALIGAPLGCLIVCGQGKEAVGGPAEIAGAVALWSAMGAGIGALVGANAWTNMRLTPPSVIVAESSSGAQPSEPPSGTSALGPPVGSRIRLRLAAPIAKVTGVVVNGTTDSLFVTTARMDQLRVARREVTSIDVSSGVNHGQGALRGVLWTIGVAAGIGGIACAAQQKCGTEWGAHPGPVPRLIWGSLLGGGAGVVLSPVGGVIGWNIGVERWAPWRH